MKRFYAFMIIIDICIIIQTLQNKMRRIVQADKPVDDYLLFQKHFISDSIIQIFTRMNFITNIHTTFIKIIQYG